MRRRTTRWVLLILLLGGVVWGAYYLLTRLADYGPLEANQLLLPALSAALVVLTLGLAGVLIRNLVKLIVEHKRGLLGSRLRTKLVFFFLALVLLPAIVLFSGSAQVIKLTVEGILRTPIEQLSSGRRLVDQWTEHFRDQSQRRARLVADEVRAGDYLEAERHAELAALVQRRREQEDLHLLWVLSGGRLLAAAQRPGPAGADESQIERVRELAERAVAEGREQYWVAAARNGTGVRVFAAVPIEPTPTPEGWRHRATVVAGLAVPPRIAANLQIIDRAEWDYRQFRSQRRDLVRFYITLIGLIFVVTLFVATWLGFYLSRRITEPIRELAAASREISAGNLGVRVRTRIGDEMGTLVEAFNEMAAELQENREVITRSTAELRRSNQALDERRRYIETLLANLSTAVVSLDPAGRVTTTNPAVRELLQVELRPGDDARGTIAARPGLRPLAAALDEALGAPARTERRDLELRGEDGATLHVSLQCSPLRGRGDEDLGTLFMVEDLSDVLRAQKAQAWGEVARRIAHEIKNPLTPIQLAAQRLRKKFFSRSDDLDQVLLESTDSIEREVGGLKQLVDEFSRFARMPELSPRPVDLKEVVESVLSLYQGLAGIRWEVDLDPAMGAVILDPQQIRRALINLVDNAVAAVEQQGTIHVAAGRGGREDTLRIEVADSGPGVPPADRAKMFVPYFSTKKRGTGLGLAIVHRVVTDHRGTIRVEDNRPRGARFVIEIPARPATPAPAEGGRGIV